MSRPLIITPLTPEQQQMVTDNIGLAYYMADKVMSRRPDIFKPTRLGYYADDVRSVAYIALCKAVTAFRPELGFAFSSYSCKCMERALYKAIETGMLGDMDVVADDTEDHNLIEMMADPVDQIRQTENGVDTAQEAAQVLELIHSLLENAKLSISERHGLEYYLELYETFKQNDLMYMKDYAKEHGVTRQMASLWARAARTRLKAELEQITQRESE